MCLNKQHLPCNMHAVILVRIECSGRRDYMDPCGRVRRNPAALKAAVDYQSNRTRTEERNTDTQTRGLGRLGRLPFACFAGAVAQKKQGNQYRRYLHSFRAPGGFHFEAFAISAEPHKSGLALPSRRYATKRCRCSLLTSHPAPWGQ